MLLVVLRFLRGYVDFAVVGGFPERFINICSRNRIRVWEVRRHGDDITARMYFRDYRRIRRFARSSGVRTKILNRSGLPDILRSHSDRAGVCIGAGVFAATVFVMSLFVWSIDVSGIETLSEAEVRTLLREEGLYVGAFKPMLDSMSVSRAVMLKNNRIGWMAVNMSGSYASVEIKEETPEPEIVDIYQPCNVKASRDGVILEIDAGEGETLLLEGSGVVKGQLVVSGVMEDAQGGSRLVHADARVIARTTHTASFSVPAVYERCQPTGESAERTSADLFGWMFPLNFGGVSSEYAVVDAVGQRPAVLGTVLPVAFIKEHISALKKTSIKLDENSAEELLIRQSRLYEAFELSECTVTDRKCSLSYHDDTYTLDVTYTCTEDVACQEPIGIGEIE